VIVAPRGGLPYQSRRVNGELTYKPVLRTVPIIISIVAVIIVAGIVSSLYPIINNSAKDSPSIYYTLTINMDGNGAPRGNGAYNEKTVVSINANPAPLWEFVEWTGDIDTIADNLSNSTSIMMDGDYTITANFTKLRDITLYDISNVVFVPQSPATLDYGEWVTIEFDYTTDINLLPENSDEVIWRDVYAEVHPFTNGALAPGYTVNEYNLLRYSQQVRSEFTIKPQPGQAIIDQIRIQIQNADRSVILYEALFPVELIFQ